MMPRRISVVPPWMVSLGAIMVAKASCSASVARFMTSGSRNAERSRTRPGSFCSQMVPRSLTIEPFDHRLLAGLQHAGDRHRHAPQRVQLRDQPAEPFGAAQVGLRSERADQFEQHVEGFEETLRSAALVGEFAGRLFPRAVDLAHDVVVGHERILEHDLVEIVLSRSSGRSD